MARRRGLRPDGVWRVDWTCGRVILRVRVRVSWIWPMCVRVPFASELRNDGSVRLVGGVANNTGRVSQGWARKRALVRNA